MAAVKHSTLDTYKTRCDQQLKTEQGLVKNNRVRFPGLPQLYQTQVTWQQGIPWETQPNAQDSCPGAHERGGSITELMIHRNISNHKHQTQNRGGGWRVLHPSVAEDFKLWTEILRCNYEGNDTLKEVCNALFCLQFSKEYTVRTTEPSVWMTAPDLSVDLKTSGRAPAQVGMDFSGNCGSESSIMVI